MREHRLVGGVVSKLLVLREDVVHESRSAAPMPEDKYRSILDGLFGQPLFITTVLDAVCQAQQAADGFGETIFGFVAFIDLSSGGYLMERFPIGSYQGVDG